MHLYSKKNIPVIFPSLLFINLDCCVKDVPRLKYYVDLILPENNAPFHQYRDNRTSQKLITPFSSNMILDVASVATTSSLHAKTNRTNVG